MASNLLAVSYISKSSGPSMVTEQILRYLAEHPDAKDAVEGIHKYWLIGASIPAAVEEVQNGLNLLVQSGWVIVSQNSLTPRLYRLNKDRLNEIQTFLSRRKVREREELSH